MQAATQSAQPPHEPCAQGLHHSFVSQSPSKLHGRDSQCAKRASHETSSIASAPQSAPSQPQPETGSQAIPFQAQPRNASQNPTPRASIGRHSSPGHAGHVVPAAEQNVLPSQSLQHTPAPQSSSEKQPGGGHAMSGHPPADSSTQNPSPEQPGQQI